MEIAEKIDTIEKNISEVITNLGEDLKRDGLIKTPTRVSKSLKFLTSGYRQDLNSIVNGALFDSNINEMVMVKNTELYSLCEHHLLPFLGKCHVAYIPKGKIIGLSKIPRIINVFSRRLQTQERLTLQIAEAIQTVTAAEGVGVIIECQHLCMMMRGVEKQHSLMSTATTLGKIRDDAILRKEFFNLASQSKAY